MADVLSQLPVKLTNNTNTAAITSENALQVDLGATTANSTSLKFTGAGTAGSSDTGVVTVQGITGGISVPVSVSVVSTGIVAYYNTVASVSNGSTGTITYTVTTGKTLYLKGVFASSSGAPCKVTVNYGSTILAVGFYVPTNPFISFQFYQPIAISSGTAVNVVILNNNGAAQDVYATIMGEEI